MAVKILLVNIIVNLFIFAFFLFLVQCGSWGGDNIEKWVENQYVAPNGPCLTVPFC